MRVRKSGSGLARVRQRLTQDIEVVSAALFLDCEATESRYADSGVCNYRTDGRRSSVGQDTSVGRHRL